ncbi:hypothetical protein JK358_32710 [Nocardia sp. 2]|uniref:Uncharacterized protein n=1 Tax=Nocardia acididurans TaxID=2802282 RepID=A0ABS1MF35_9NOCA|nr:hypothetical protein [Nocardia acididurans]MBL1079177.1 hypothetical protein [Nocardia acididurans]
MVVGIILVGPFASDYFWRGEQLTGVFGLVGGLAALTMAAPLLLASRVRQDKLPRRICVSSVGNHRRGLRIDVRASWKPLIIVWLLLGAGFIALRGAISLRNYSTTEDPIFMGLNAGGIVMVTILLVAIFSVLSTMVFGRHKHFLAVTEEGVIKAAGKSKSTIAWDDIDRIMPVLYSNMHAVQISPRPWMKVQVEGGGFGRHELELSMVIHAWNLKIDPPLLLCLLRFYWRYPELRTELTSDAVIDRMRRTNFRRPKTLRQDDSKSESSDRSAIRFRSARGLDSSPSADS